MLPLTTFHISIFSHHLYQALQIDGSILPAIRIMIMIMIVIMIKIMKNNMNTYQTIIRTIIVTHNYVLVTQFNLIN